MDFGQGVGALERYVRTADGQTLQAVIGLVNSVMRRSVSPERGMQRRFPWVFGLANSRNVYLLCTGRSRPADQHCVAGSRGNCDRWCAAGRGIDRIGRHSA